MFFMSATLTQISIKRKIFPKNILAAQASFLRTQLVFAPEGNECGTVGSIKKEKKGDVNDFKSE